MIARAVARPMFVLGFAAVVLTISIAAAPGGPASTTKGVYTEAQAAEGAELYKGACAICHGESLAGSFEVPALTGRFIANWSNGSVGTLFDYISHAMPQMAPGSLSPEDNAKIVAYLLKANNLPAGARPLPSDQAALDRIAFEPVRRID